jgi:hypothetical protein
MIFDLNFDRVYERIKKTISCNTAFNLYSKFYRAFKERCRRFREDEKYRAKTCIADHVEHYITWLAAEELLKQKPLPERAEALRKIKDERRRMDAQEYGLAGVIASNDLDEQDSSIAEFERKFLD